MEALYSEYEYENLRDIAISKFKILRDYVWSKIGQSKGKKDHIKFLQYLCDIYKWYYYKIILPSEVREDINDCIGLYRILLQKLYNILTTIKYFSRSMTIHRLLNILCYHFQFHTLPLLLSE